MRNFSYKARNSVGRVISGTLQAEDESDALLKLEAERLMPIAINLTAKQKKQGGGGVFAPRLKPQHIIIFTRQLSTLLDAGMPILQSLDVLRMQADHPLLKDALVGMSKSVADGSKLSEAMAEFPRIFPEEYIGIVVTGESGADLVQALVRMADWMEREQEIRDEIKSALRYPIIVLCVLFAASMIMATFVRPRLALFFVKSAVPLPLPTRMLLAGNAFFQEHWGVVLGVLGAVPLVWAFLLKKRRFRLMVDGFRFRMPLFGTLYAKIVLSRFSRIFSMLVKNGVPVIRALDICAEVTANTALRAALTEAHNSLERGSTVSGSLGAVAMFPPIMTNLIAIGERTGSLDEMLEFVVMQYEIDIKYALKSLTASIEPVLTVIIGGAVLFISLAVFLPMWDLAKVMKQ